MKCEYCDEKADEYCHECEKPVCGEHSSLESDGDSLKAVCHNCVQKSHDDLCKKPHCGSDCIRINRGPLTREDLEPIGREKRLLVCFEGSWSTYSTEFLFACIGNIQHITAWAVLPKEM